MGQHSAGDGQIALDEGLEPGVGQSGKRYSSGDPIPEQPGTEGGAENGRDESNHLSSVEARGGIYNRRSCLVLGGSRGVQ